MKRSVERKIGRLVTLSQKNGKSSSFVKKSSSLGEKDSLSISIRTKKEANLFLKELKSISKSNTK